MFASKKFQNYFQHPEFKFTLKSALENWEEYDAVVVPIPHHYVEKKEPLNFLPEKMRKDISQLTTRRDFKFKKGECFTCDWQNHTLVSLVVLDDDLTMFGLLEQARHALSPVLKAKCKKVLLELRGVQENGADFVDAFISASQVMTLKLPKFTEKSQESSAYELVCAPAHETLAMNAQKAHLSSQATNLVRRLTFLPGNQLSPDKYRDLAQQFCKELGLKCEFIPVAKLKTMGAGAFVAVAQGSTNPGQGILKITYEPAGTKKTRAPKVALVGKGVTFDTGGNNLKTGGYMFGMNEDMSGSSIALALVLLAQRAKWPCSVTSYLAVVENLIGPDSYRPNDVVKTLSGKTIEVVDTDAEGRMILSDTLALAAQAKPDVLVDFATLTGSCIRALGTSYSGVYSNKSSLLKIAKKAGTESGERVWPFPNDADYLRALKSDVADIKQCRVAGGPDHIEASLFLSSFVPKSTPWLHVDLAAAKTDDGLAHVPTKTTGFGVRFAIAFLERYFEQHLF